MKRLVINSDIQEACNDAALRYSHLSFDSANIAFSYEFYGYAKSMVETYGLTLDQVLIKTEEMGMLLRSANS